ncbi:MAG: hypothetical protein J6V25_13445 [Oscillospiraceae bacterium]|nr:hypothetical protein [Oscillospiraceae bacterium]
MTEAAMKYMSDLMDSLSIPYDFVEWKTKPPDDRYFVGEPLEDIMTTLEEDGQQDITFILRGFTRVDYSLLMKDAQTIKENLPQTAILPDGTGIAVFYEGSRPVQTADNQLKSIKTNLKIKEWKVN